MAFSDHSGSHSTASAGGPVGASGHTREDLRHESFGELLSGLASDMSVLVKQEIQLAKVETTAKAKEAGKGAGMLAGAAVAGLLLLMALTTLLVVALDYVMPLWVAVLVAVVLWAVVAAALGLAGKKQLQEATPPVPEQTVETVKEDVQWAKNPTRSART
ncbi:phage holin family protein [Aquipuribacter nitratireducens]|uniref:Phage holin family protein n=1 Tax=Aquipuribacter nitratireducens TaxID=650104 RepID=A0ABW0GLM8_9MICO